MSHVTLDGDKQIRMPGVLVNAETTPEVADDGVTYRDTDVHVSTAGIDTDTHGVTITVNGTKVYDSGRPDLLPVVLPVAHHRLLLDALNRVAAQAEADAEQIRNTHTPSGNPNVIEIPDMAHGMLIQLCRIIADAFPAQVHDHDPVVQG